MNSNDEFLVLLHANREVQDHSGDVLSLVPLLRSDGAIDHVRHGLCRRLLLIQRSTALICDLTPPERDEPLSDEESGDLNLHLNSTYVHIRGATDNIAWALAFEHRVLGEPRENDRAFQRQVGLFGKAFQNGLSAFDPELATVLLRHVTTLSELPQLRDPVAHRVPLYVVPAVLSEEESRRHAELEDQWNKALAAHDLDGAGEIMTSMWSLGEFRPKFAHSLREPLSVFPLHARLGGDLCALSSIVRVSLELFRTHAA